MVALTRKIVNIGQPFPSGFAKRMATCEMAAVEGGAEPSFS
jgi:hypothetical protein